MRNKLLYILLGLLVIGVVNGQSVPLQSIKGRITERNIKTVIAAATIKVIGMDEKTAVSDSSGFFKFNNIPVGRTSILITHIGFKPIVLNNLLLESGKELVLTVEMEEDLSTSKEIIIKSNRNKARPINDLAMVSARMFSVEETRRFAAGLNDPARIAANFAGVASAGDGNGLIIRGNAPNGLLWRMEGVDIPNPNHFARVGTSGGAISMLSAQLLANSDFITGAFPSEYGNALSGVFDIRLRKGNKDKREHTFSLSTLGIDFATEGYLKKGYGGSYLINYRYGFLTLMQKLGFNISDKPTSFQDLSLNIHLPTKKIGSFSVFGFGGLSKQYDELARDSITWINNPSTRSSSLDAANAGAMGVSHQINLGKKILWRSVLSKNGYLYREEDSRLEKFNGPVVFTRINKFSEWNTQFSSVLTFKASKHHLFKLGAYTKDIAFNLQQREAVSNVLRDKIKNNGSTWLTNYFVQWKWDASNKFSFQLGGHGQQLGFNKSSAFQPRFGLRYQTGNGQFLSFGYGMHSQIQPLGNYFARIRVGNDTVLPNKMLDFSKSKHYVLGYSIQIAKDWNLKTEVYYQWLYNIPIHALRSSNYSVINLDDDFSIETLSNTGLGQNYGLELTLDRYWNDRFYLLATLSLYQSEYRPSDKIWRSTRYNSNNSFTLLFGKEWVLKTKRPSYFGLDIKLISMGGVRVTPIDLVQSSIRKTTVSIASRYNDEKLRSIFRIDAQFEWKVQYRKTTGSLILGMQNATNRKNPISHRYDANQGKITYNYLLGRIPVFGYKVDF
ncbi:MAG: carboxypeptidase regulatory-like domain-containing protein [Bacteroidota bacterium]|jgi:hypothetical protein|nr:TonB-dependent receptor [Chitinophagaceae bacterium]